MTPYTILDGPYGYTGGQAFNDYNHYAERGPPTAMQIRASDRDFDGIRFKYGEVWGPLRGNSNSLNIKLHEVNFVYQEKIVKVRGEKRQEHQTMYCYIFTEKLKIMNAL